MNLITLIFAALLGTQAPDINGTWKMIPDRSGSPTQTPPVPEMTLRLASSADEVRVNWLSGADPGEVVYTMVAPPPKAGGTPADPPAAGVKRAYWQDGKLVLERGGTINGQTVSMKQSLSLDPATNELVVERLVIVQHGYTLKGTPNYATVKDVFARAQ
jgi:hypothetical protein